MTRMIATLFGIGYLHPAPGTWGSLAALPLAWLLHVTLGFWGFALVTMIVFGLGLWATGIEIAGRDIHDPSEIVIDEVVGQWLALWPVSYGAAMVGVDITRLWPGWIAAFVLFRLFDILKPGPIGTLDARNDAMGVMMDDLLAGFAAALCVMLLGILYHWLRF